jgi:hypothetical protein
MQTTVNALLAQAITQQQQRNAAALAAIESRAPDIAILDRLVRNLRARDWKAEALVETEPVGSHAVCRLLLLLSCSENELGNVLEHLGADGIGVDRWVTGDIGCSRQYQLRLDRCTVRLHAYVHTPARVAA